MRVPMPPRALPAAQVAEARGFTDSMALKLRLHNAALHQARAPGEPVARAVYDAIEQVRYEALGSDGYAGIRGNIGAATDVRMLSDPIARAARAEDVPLQTAVSLLLREALTGQPVPESARLGTDLVRSWIEAKAGEDFSALADVLGNQKAFQQLALDLLGHLELTSPTDAPPTDSDDDQGDDQDDGEEQPDAGEDAADQTPSEMAGDTSEGGEDGDQDQEPGEIEDSADADIADDGEEGMLPTRPNRPWTD